MELIIESGATKTDIRLFDEDGIEKFMEAGINLASMKYDTVRDVLDNVICRIPDREKVRNIHFYGAGIISDSAIVSGKDQLPSWLQPADALLKDGFPAAEIEYCSDLMAASRALWGRESGIAVILGTGSNSCLYDGCRIVKNVRPCGYILGDFGGGAALGKIFMADYLQDVMPDSLASDFRLRYGVDYASAVRNIYKGEAPAAYLASFVPYILDMMKTSSDAEAVEYLAGIVTDNFRAFFGRCLMQYDTGRYDVGVTGSFGCACQDILEKTAGGYGICLARFKPAPADALVAYHLSGSRSIPI